MEITAADVTAADVYAFLEASADADDPSFAELFTEPTASKTTACEPNKQENGQPSLSHHGALDGIGAGSMLSSRLGSPSLSLPHLQPWNPAVAQLPALCSTTNPSGAQLANQLLLLQQQQLKQRQQQEQQQLMQLQEEQQRQQQQQLLLHQIQPQHPCPAC